MTKDVNPSPLIILHPPCLFLWKGRRSVDKGCGGGDRRATDRPTDRWGWGANRLSDRLRDTGQRSHPVGRVQSVVPPQDPDDGQPTVSATLVVGAQGGQGFPAGSKSVGLKNPGRKRRRPFVGVVAEGGLSLLPKSFPAVSSRVPVPSPPRDGPLEVRPHFDAFLAALGVSRHPPPPPVADPLRSSRRPAAAQETTPHTDGGFRFVIATVFDLIFAIFTPPESDECLVLALPQRPPSFRTALVGIQEASGL